MNLILVIMLLHQNTIDWSVYNLNTLSVICCQDSVLPTAFEVISFNETSKPSPFIDFNSYYFFFLSPIKTEMKWFRFHLIEIFDGTQILCTVFKSNTMEEWDWMVNQLFRDCVKIRPQFCFVASARSVRGVDVIMIKWVLKF